MLPQKPEHVSQEIWELELPSILGLAHPRISDDGTDSDAFSPLGPDVFTQPTQASDQAIAGVSASSSTLAAASSSSPTSRNPMTHTSRSTTAGSDPIIDVDADMTDSVDQSALGSQVSTAPEALAITAGDWGDVWNMERPEQGFITYELQLDNITLPPAPARDASAMEWLAYFVCSKRSCTTDDLRHLCQLLPPQTSAKRRRTTTSDGGTGRTQRSFSVGAYSAGGCHGIQCNTFNFPWTACWLASMVQAAAPSHQYSTCTLLHNVMHFRHTDSRNAPNTTNLIIPCDFWRGGQLWVNFTVPSIWTPLRGQGCCGR